MVDWPKRIKLGAHAIKLEMHEGKLGDAAGEWIPWKHTIRLDTLSGAESRCGDMCMLHCLVHEVVHAIDGTYCDYRVFQGPKHGDESDWINPFCEGLLQALMDNWDALEKIKKTLDKG